MAKRLNVSLAFVYRRYRTGELAAFRFGDGPSTWRIPEDELNAFLRELPQRAELSISALRAVEDQLVRLVSR